MLGSGSKNKPSLLSSDKLPKLPKLDLPKLNCPHPPRGVYLVLAFPIVQLLFMAVFDGREGRSAADFGGFRHVQ